MPLFKCLLSAFQINLVFGPCTHFVAAEVLYNFKTNKILQNSLSSLRPMHSREVRGVDCLSLFILLMLYYRSPTCPQSASCSQESPSPLHLSSTSSRSPLRTRLNVSVDSSAWTSPLMWDHCGFLVMCLWASTTHSLTWATSVLGLLLLCRIVEGEVKK